MCVEEISEDGLIQFLFKNKLAFLLVFGIKAEFVIIQYKYY